MRPNALSMPLLVGLMLAGCSQTTGDYPGGADAPLRTGSATDEQACLTAVGREARNSVTILSSEFSQANTLVMVGVGPQKAPWRCLVSGGVVAEVSFAGSEGSL